MLNRRAQTWRAYGVSALAHLALAVLTWNLPLISPAAAQKAAERAQTAPEAIELTLEPDAADAAPEAALPRAYTDVPERHAAEMAPERADFLALRHSRAADLLPGGQRDAPPGAPLESDAPQVEIRPENLAAAAGVVVLPPGAEPLAERGGAAAGAAASAPRGAEGSAAGNEPLAAGRLDSSMPVPSAAERSGKDRKGEAAAGGAARGQADGSGQGEQESRADWLDLSGLRGLSPPSLLGGEQAEPGQDRGFEFSQRAVGWRGGNTFDFGDYRLNTYEWNFAPWMQRFGQDLRRNWLPPYAFMLGIISGRTQLRVVVEKDGRLGSVAVVQTEGHESLHQSSEAALHGAAPFAPLPADFPEENLVILLTLIYPDWKSQYQEQERAPERGPGTPPTRRGRR